MRGKGGGYSTIEAKMRITPAYAGKSRRLRSLSSPFGDHPRLCGEKLTACTKSGSNPGSPPPMRGKGPPVADVWKRSGITPAYAGKSLTLPTSSTGKGSPPPMRGKAGKNKAVETGFGITPAYAGKRTAGSGGLNHEQDHPRLCGEKHHLRFPPV